MPKKILLSGFTLMELMITVAVVGILAGIAYPGYLRYTTQARRTDAQVVLTQIASRQERFFTQCNYYAVTMNGIRGCGTVGNVSSILGDFTSNLSPDRHYAVTMSAGIIQLDGTVAPNCSTWTCGFTAVASPTGAGTTGRQVGDGSFMTNSVGQKFWDRNNDGNYTGPKEDTWTK